MAHGDTLPPPFLDEDGIWRDPIPIEQMTRKQRSTYVKLLREDAGFSHPRSELRQAREQMAEFLAHLAPPSSG